MKSIDKNRKKIPEKVVRELWARSAGRCGFEGCNKELWRAARTKISGNRGHIAHIVAAEPNGARGHAVRSAQLCKAYENLMLVCYDCHDEIDNLETRHKYSEERLLLMKQRHEERIERQTATHKDNDSEILLFGANIGQHGFPLTYDECRLAITPDYYPASASPIALGVSNSGIEDTDELYWQYEKRNLEDQFRHKVHARIKGGEIRHLSVFGLAPQPLLIQLGTLLGDIVPTVVYQRHREPIGWLWRDAGPEVQLTVQVPEYDSPVIALNLSLSGTITKDRIQDVLGPNCAIWTLTHDQPHNDFVRTADQLADFRVIVRRMLDSIKARHGQNAELHLFPAIPVSMAIELGRVRMPKADIPFIIYDQNRLNGGFTKAFTLN